MKCNMKEMDKKFISDVLNHYNKYSRHDLVWRKKITPYRILVSEIMLQQTQVERVKEKFVLWMKMCPTLHDLSKSSLEDILKLWKGLGYQRRAKALYTIGHTVKRIPKTFEGLIELPGVGIYTASAVCAFAYNTFSHPVLETNIRTALIEAFYTQINNLNSIEEKIHDDILYSDLVRLSSYKVVKECGAREWYYALMDYGAFLKKSKISHNHKSKSYNKQSAYKGSRRELRAKVLFSILHKEALPEDKRTEEIIDELIQEGYLVNTKTGYRIAESFD